MADPNVSTVVTKGAPLSHARMEDCALKRPASRSSTASVPLGGQVNGVSRAANPLSPRRPRAHWRTVTAKPMMVFVTRNVTRYLVAGTVVTVL